MMARGPLPAIAWGGLITLFAGGFAGGGALAAAPAPAASGLAGADSPGQVVLKVYSDYV